MQSTHASDWKKYSVVDMNRVWVNYDHAKLELYTNNNQTAWC